MTSFNRRKLVNFDSMSFVEKLYNQISLKKKNYPIKRSDANMAYPIKKNKLYNARVL